MEGYYENLTLESVPELKDDEILQSLIDDVWNFYNEFLYNKNNYYVDDDTSYEIFFNGDFQNSYFYCSKIQINFEFLDEMNDVVSQMIIVDFDSGMVYITDDDYGLIYKRYIEKFDIYKEEEK
jgi:hypothetical protein